MYAPLFLLRSDSGFGPSSFDDPLHSIHYMTDTNGDIASMPPESLQEMATPTSDILPASWTPQEAHLTKQCESVIFCRWCSICLCAPKWVCSAYRKAARVSSVHGMRKGKKASFKIHQLSPIGGRELLSELEAREVSCSVKGRYLSVGIAVNLSYWTSAGKRRVTGLLPAAIRNSRASKVMVKLRRLIK